MTLKFQKIDNQLDFSPHVFTFATYLLCDDSSIARDLLLNLSQVYTRRVFFFRSLFIEVSTREKKRKKICRCCRRVQSNQ